MKINAWYYNIPPTGILCKVCKYPKQPIIRLVLRYHPNRMCSFETDSGKFYEIAVPLTKDEILELTNTTLVN